MLPMPVENGLGFSEEGRIRRPPLPVIGLTIGELLFRDREPNRESEDPVLLLDGLQAEGDRVKGELPPYSERMPRWNDRPTPRTPTLFTGELCEGEIDRAL